ncbi:MAG: hypothetical protein H6737_09340 [Alphaproteobacteria bacterium]|nr:hypothetical protein [Alphaproteobacteria bacterium]
MRRVLPLLLLGCPGPDPDRREPSGFCGSGDLPQAPPPVDSALGPVAPVDLQSVHTQVRVTTGGLEVTSTATLLVGERDARPVLELRPDPAEARLDGAPVALERVTVSRPGREVVVLPALDPCTEHVLELSYTLAPDWLLGEGDQTRMEVYGEGVFWAAGLEDDAPGKFLSMWMPSNLLFDRFDVALDIDVSALAGPHEILATGTTVETDAGWSLEWDRTLAHSPYWVISPTALTVRASRVAALEDGPVTVEVRALSMDDGADVEEAAERAEAALTEFSAAFGPYHHGDRYLVWIRDEQQSSMEYDGATLTAMGAIEHEIMHSWFARGAAPVADLHGWVDEAVTSWVTDILPYRAVPIPYDTDPMVLQVGDDEWAGPELGVGQYVFGSSIFAGIADAHGVDATVEALGAFYVAWAGRSYRSADLEEHLTCWFDDDEVRHAFRHRAYGLEGPPGPRPFHWCR